MYKKKIRYTDFLGNVREETHVFNLNENELIHLELETDGGLRSFLEGVSERQDISKISKFWDSFIKRSYGVVSDDGRKFIKNDEVWEDFHQSGAYNELYMLLTTNDEEAFNFIKAVIPSGKKEQGNDANLVAIEKAKALAEQKMNESK